MSVNQLSNPLIRSHKEGAIDGAPNLDNYRSFDTFIAAHRLWLVELRLENADATADLIKSIRSEKSSVRLAYLSGVLHIRKEYAAYLTHGIESCNKVLGA